MMTSYLIIGFASESVPQNYCPNLPDLVRLGVRSFRLQVQYLLDSIPRKDVVTAARPFSKAQALEKLTDAAKGDIGIGRPTKELLEKLVKARHGGTPGSQRNVPMFLRWESGSLSFQQLEGDDQLFARLGGLDDLVEVAALGGDVGVGEILDILGDLRCADLGRAIRELAL